MHFTLSLFFFFLVSSARAVNLGGKHLDSGQGGPEELTSVTQRASRFECQPFSTRFSPGQISGSSSAPFIAISPEESYDTSSSGLRMFLKKPSGSITRKGHVNDKIADGATINSTFLMQYGKTTFEMQAPAVAGVVTAAILVSNGHDEIDIEDIGGDPRHWQTNVYSPSPEDKQPLWGAFGEYHDVGSSNSATISDFHNYTIDWNGDRIIWSIDGKTVRTLTPEQTRINGTEHYPTQPCRIQLGIWDASSPEGTSEWAKGPIDWQKAPSTITATVRSVRVECH